MRRVFEFVTDKNNKHFFDNCFYHLIMFSLVFLLYIFFIGMEEVNNSYINIFLFLLTAFCLIKYYLSCKQTFIPLSSKKLPISILILTGYLINSLLWIAISNLMIHLYGTVEILNQQLIDKRVQENPEIIVSHILLTVIAAPIVEEIIYRGLLLNAVLFVSKKLGISRNKSFIVFLFLTSLLFSSAHASNNILTFLGFALTGLIFGLLYILSGNLLVPITVHFINNLSVNLGITDNTKRFLIFLILLAIIIFIEYFSKDERNIFKKRFINF